MAVTITFTFVGEVIHAVEQIGVGGPGADGR